MKNLFLYSLILLVFLGGCGNRNASNATDHVAFLEEGSMRYLENDRVKLGIDLDLGGAVTYLSDQANGGQNMINSFDWGRQIQLSYYSGPWPYIGPNGEEPSPAWHGLGWNPIQSGDAGGHRSRVTGFEFRDDNSMYVRCVPMQWPHTTGIAGECYFECVYTLSGNIFTMEATINVHRSDKKQYKAVTQEMPALYTNGPWYQLVTYLGDKPFTGEPVTVVADKNDGKGWPWVHFYSPEQWAALLDESGTGIGVFQPEAMTFNGGFHGGDPNKGKGGEKDGQTGHIAPTTRQIIDHNISWTYTTSFVLGTIDDIRSYARDNRTKKSIPEWTFPDSRQGWYYSEGMSDTGWPVDGQLVVQFAKDSRFIGPLTFWNAEDAPYLEIEGMFDTHTRQLDIEISIQPVGKSDFTDWLNWSEGDHDTEKEKQEKSTAYPPTPPFQVKQTIQADGVNRACRINLSDIPQYKGAMKSLSIRFSDGGLAKIERIGFVSI